MAESQKPRLLKAKMQIIRKMQQISGRRNSTSMKRSTRSTAISITPPIALKITARIRQNHDAFEKKPLLASMYFSLFIDASQNCIENILILLYEYIV